MYDRNHYWPILSADTVTDTETDTETTFQRENLMGYFSHHKRAPKTKLAAKYQRFISLFLKIIVQLQAFKNLYNPKKQENMRKFEKFEKKKFWFRKKKFRLQY